MNAVQVVETLLNLGVSIGSEGNKLLLEPGSRVPPELVPDIRRYKPEILHLLAAPINDYENSTQALLAWAAQAAETGLTLPEPVQFLETPLRPSTTAEAGRYCRDHLKYLTLARTNRAHGGWGRFTPEWWTKMESNSLEALAALKTAIEATHREGESPE